MKENISVIKIYKVMNELEMSIPLLKKRSFKKYLFTSVLMLLMCSSSNVFAQSDAGTITGSVSFSEDVDITTYVILLEERNEVAPITENGSYVLEEVPEGEYTLIFRTRDEVIEEASVTVVSGETVEQNFELIQATSQGDISEVANNGNDEIRATLNSEQISGFGDYSVEEALARMAGAQVAHDGNINLRGTGYNSYYVMLNGQRMGTTGLGDRGFDLGAISTDMISEIEWIKVLTPDMYADGLAGAINLKTYNSVAAESEIVFGIGGGATPEHYNLTGATGRFWGRIIQSVSDEMSIALNFSYQQAQEVSNSLGIGYGLTDFGNGNTDVIEQISPAIQTDERGRLAGSIQLDYQPSESTNFYVQGMVNTDNRQRIRHRNNWLANGSWENSNTTSTQASFVYDMRNEDIEISQYTFRAGGRHLFDPVILEYSAGWSQSTIEKNEYHFPFQATGVEYTIDAEDRDRPVPAAVEAAPTGEDLTLSDMTYIIDQHIDQKYSGNIDVEIPFDLGSIKVGTSALVTNKDANDEGAYNEYLYTYLGFLNLNEFEQQDIQSIDLFDDQYEMPWLLDSEETRSFFDATLPNLRLDRTLNNRTSPIWNYFANEQIYSGYGMATLNFGAITVVGGARLEHTVSEYDGRVVGFNRFDQFDSRTDTSVSSNYTHLFPHAQIAFEPTDESSIRLAYSKSISRPDFNLLAPFELITPADTSIFKGNPDLKPIESDNFDLFLNQSVAGSGMISVGAFYKRLNNFISEDVQSVSLQEGERVLFDDFFDEETSEILVDERSFINEEETANIYGVEVGWQQRLTFLPGLMNNLGTYVNYTWSSSTYTSSSTGEETALPGQRPHVVNAAIDYSQDRFFAQLSYHWSAEAINQLARNRRYIPFQNSEEFMNRYQEGYQDLSASISYKISDEVQLWANVYNLISSEEVEYRFDRDIYPTNFYQRDGIEFSLGVQLNF